LLRFFKILPLIVTFVGIISNIYTVCKSAAFLAWICKLPSPVVGIISVCLFGKILTFAARFLISGLFIGYFAACVVGSAYDVAPYRSPSFGAL
jgi:xanthine/uracil permease